MTLKEAVLKSLEDINEETSPAAVLKNIEVKGYYDFSLTKKPGVSGVLGDFIRNGDTRVSRSIQNGGMYFYSLSKNGTNSTKDVSVKAKETVKKSVEKNVKIKTYDEKNLHKLLSSYLKSTFVYSKTIFHEESTFSKDSNQIWSHPDMVGIRFLNLQNRVSQNFLKLISRADTFKFSSYELKKEINSDTELKKAFFQAVSNSSWANYGYLVAFEFSTNLSDEMERLNQSFGIGIIKLNSNPFQSRILFPAKHRELDFKTIDKLCKINKKFENFIEKTEKLMTAKEGYFESTEKELTEFCDEYFKNETESEQYCKENHIPIEIDNNSIL